MKLGRWVASVKQCETVGDGHRPSGEGVGGASRVKVHFCNVLVMKRLRFFAVTLRDVQGTFKVQIGYRLGE